MGSPTQQFFVTAPGGGRYVRDVQASVHRPDRELKGFHKMRLDPGVSGTVTISLPPRAFAFYDIVSNRVGGVWMGCGGGVGVEWSRDVERLWPERGRVWGAGWGGWRCGIVEWDGCGWGGWGRGADSQSPIA